MSGTQTPHIRHVRVKNLCCLADVTIRPTQLHAIVGPAMSGKTLLLRAIRAALAYRDERGNDGLPMGPQSSVALAAQDESGELREGAALTRGKHGTLGVLFVVPSDDDPEGVTTRVASGKPFARLGEEGLLGSVFAACRSSFGRDLAEVNEALREAFPWTRGLAFDHEPGASLRILLSGPDGEPVTTLSEGAAAMMGIASLLALGPRSAVLLSRPERYLQPAQVRQAARILRIVSERTQVIVETDSPLLLDGFRADEVTVLARTGLGATTAHRLSDLADADGFDRDFGAGSLWSRACDGVNDRRMFRDAPAGPVLDLASVACDCGGIAPCAWRPVSRQCACRRCASEPDPADRFFHCIGHRESAEAQHARVYPAHAPVWEPLRLAQ